MPKSKDYEPGSFEYMYNQLDFIISYFYPEEVCMLN